jgi:hypothetical protein
MVLHLQRASDDVVVFLPLTASDCSYFLQQNIGIKHGTVEGVPIKLKVLGIGNGLTVRAQRCLAGRRVANGLNQDPLTQYPGYIQYATSNPYHPMVSPSVIAAATTAWSEPGGCRDQVSLSLVRMVLDVLKCM